jgi:hypothetical protein
MGHDLLSIHALWFRRFDEGLGWDSSGVMDMESIVYWHDIMNSRSFVHINTYLDLLCRWTEKILKHLLSHWVFDVHISPS